MVTVEPLCCILETSIRLYISDTSIKKEHVYTHACTHTRAHTHTHTHTQKSCRSSLIGWILDIAWVGTGLWGWQHMLKNDLEDE